MAKLKFLGASGTVTGSKYLVEGGGKRILVDAGLFQGERKWRERNWDKPDFDLASVDAVLLTHAHIDHVGILPRYYQLGLRCPVYATKPTIELCQVLLPDSGRLQEEEASYRLERGRSRHTPPQPLYTERDAIDALQLFRPVPFHQRVEVLDGITARWTWMGHILGAAAIRLEIGGKVINFSGDIGRYTVPILKDPEPVDLGDLLLIESTYGDRLHPAHNPKEPLAEIINRTAKRRGVVLVPAFAVGRTQQLLFYLRELKEANAIPDVPVVIDSPMATDATKIYYNNPSDYDEESVGILKRGSQPFAVSRTHFVRDRKESMALNSIEDPMILISASGMLSGGRVLHHLKHRLGSSANTVLLVGHQPQGGRGDWLRKGAQSIRVLGEEVAVRAEVAELSGLSAHGDRAEMLRWCNECSGRPGKVMVVHGEPDSAQKFSRTLAEELNWDASVASYLQEISI